MGMITLKGNHENAMTLVSNIFIDCFMADANGEFVKIYLYLLRNLGGGDKEISISSLADVFNHTEKDILRALTYWEKTGLLGLVYSDRRELLAIDILDAPSKNTHKEHIKEMAAAALPKAPQKKERPNRNPHSIQELEKLKDNEDFTRLMYIAQQYMGTTFKPTDCDVFAYLYNELHFSVELLEYLVEFSVSNGHTSVRYMEGVALDWHQRSITTVERAREYTASYNKECFTVMRAFGISDRRPATVEKQMIDKWFYTYGFTAGVILEACNRTISKIHQPSFEYADKILAAWKEQGVKKKEDIAVLDLNYKNNEKQTKQKNVKAASSKSTNRFHNFEQRGYDYDELLKQME